MKMNNIFVKLLVSILIVLTLVNFIGTINVSINYSFAGDEGDEKISEMGDDDMGFIGRALWHFCKLIFVSLARGVRSINYVLASSGGVTGNGSSGEISPFDIFFNRFTLLDANIFSRTDRDGAPIPETSLVYKIRTHTSIWYYGIRAISITVIGIMLLWNLLRAVMKGTSAEQKVVAKNAITDWVLSFALVMFMHIIIIMVLNINDLLLDVIKAVNGVGADTSKFFDSLEGAIFNSNFILSVAGLLVYAILNYQTFKYIIIYIKRLLTIVLLVMISPIVPITYSLDKMKGGNGAALNGWLKELLFNVFIQVIHALVYSALVSVAMDSLTATSSIKGTSDLGPAMIAIIAMLFVKYGERMIKSIFGFDSSQVINNSRVSNVFSAVRSVGTSVARAGIKTAGEVGLGAKFGKDGLSISFGKNVDGNRGGLPQAVQSFGNNLGIGAGNTPLRQQRQALQEGFGGNAVDGGARSPRLLGVRERIDVGAEAEATATATATAEASAYAEARAENGVDGVNGKDGQDANVDDIAGGIAVFDDEQDEKDRKQDRQDEDLEANDKELQNDIDSANRNFNKSNEEFEGRLSDAEEAIKRLEDAVGNAKKDVNNSEKINNVNKTEVKEEEINENKVETEVVETQNIETTEEVTENNANNGGAREEFVDKLGDVIASSYEVGDNEKLKKQLKDAVLENEKRATNNYSDYLNNTNESIYSKGTKIRSELFAPVIGKKEIGEEDKANLIEHMNEYINKLPKNTAERDFAESVAMSYLVNMNNFDANDDKPFDIKDLENFYFAQKTSLNAANVQSSKVESSKENVEKETKVEQVKVSNNVNDNNIKPNSNEEPVNSTNSEVSFGAKVNYVQNKVNVNDIERDIGATTEALGKLNVNIEDKDLATKADMIYSDWENRYNSMAAKASAITNKPIDEVDFNDIYNSIGKDAQEELAQYRRGEVKLADMKNSDAINLIALNREARAISTIEQRAQEEGFNMEIIGRVGNREFVANDADGVGKVLHDIAGEERRKKIEHHKNEKTNEKNKKYA